MFTKRLRAFTLFALLSLIANAASAGIVTKPYTFANGPGNPVDAIKVNADYDTLYTLVNGNIDNTNINFVYASTVKPTTVGQAIFGGSVGYTFNPNAAAQVPLTIIGATAQSADLFDVCSVGAACSGIKYLWVDLSGVLHTNVAPAFGGVPTWTGACTVAQGCTGITSATSSRCVRMASTSAYAAAAGDCVTSVTASGPLASSGGTTPNLTCSTCVTSVTASGNLSSSGGTTPAISMTSAPSFSSVTVTGLTTLRCLRSDGSDNVAVANGDCIVGYNGSGTALVPAPHIAITSCAMIATNTCNAAAFSGNSAFTSASTYACAPTINVPGGGLAAITVHNTDGTHTGAVDTNQTAGTYTVVLVCTGT